MLSLNISMHAKPTTQAELTATGDFEAHCLALCEHLTQHWDGIDTLKPKGYDEFLVDYEDFQGIEEFAEKTRPGQEAVFNGFDSSSAGGFNFVTNVSLPHVAYDDTNQGRPPLMVLIGACVSYGAIMGEVSGAKTGKQELMLKLMQVLMDTTKEPE